MRVRLALLAVVCVGIAPLARATTAPVIAFDDSHGQRFNTEGDASLDLSGLSGFAGLRGLVEDDAHFQAQLPVANESKGAGGDRAPMAEKGTPRGVPFPSLPTPWQPSLPR